MIIKKLRPNQIMTTNDFPVHNEHILKIYFKVCKEGHPEILPPTPVMPISVGLPLMKGNTKKIKEFNQAIKKWFKENPKVKYIMIDGSHKTTALTLTHNPINSMIIKNLKDIKEARKLEKQGKILSVIIKPSIKAELKNKAEHYFEAEFFQTVQSKTDRMVQAKVIPKYMIDFYKKT